VTKPRYPAKWFYKLRQYPAKDCKHCGKPLMPKIRTNKNGEWLELPADFEKRRFCGAQCSARYRWAREHKRKAEAFPLEPTKPSLGRINPELRQMLSEAFNRHPDLLDVWDEATSGRVEGFFSFDF
jgi:hypothetical protein